MSIVVGDIGGTKTLLAVARPEAGGWHFEHRARLPSQDHPSLEHLLEHWLATKGDREEPISAVGLALAGPVQGENDSATARLTNLDWPPLDARGLARRFGAPVRLLNDFAAIGAGLDALRPADLDTLQAGHHDPAGLRLVVGAGTGLGTCLVGPPPQNRLFPGEGGHADFSPADAWQAALGEWVRRRLGRCTREHLLSGAGIARITAFVHEQTPAPELADALAAPDPAAAIGTLADSGNPAALQVVERFVSIYAGQVGDLALTALPRGGVFIAGGIAPRWKAHFEAPGFLQAFRNKPPMQDLAAGLPLHLIVHPEPGLLGAAAAAHRAMEPPGDTA
ncbi:Glucokinase [Thioalkalivibrio nitratireducens DSM 14787]|uniref:Glucokinase n=1 Tax=Thioalkalivibrio nitratireducens (strain DSM 14787 / UNIQEM 213 / ALEN2) TaxID=1255043 RepID=L0DZS7_THIND|nr:ROK family protein [Thioalkalivibrio nitratireducens]AGA33866.1 Glucokinase [Thioalkalivibrio nitratireducens DSM 14787]